jgi:hypothetical protein
LAYLQAGAQCVCDSLRYFAFASQIPATFKPAFSRFVACRQNHGHVNLRKFEKLVNFAFAGKLSENHPPIVALTQAFFTVFC